jgi:hypothetical protein
MAFQVIELTLDADDNVIQRRAVPYPYPTREEAVGNVPIDVEIGGQALPALSH